MSGETIIQLALSLVAAIAIIIVIYRISKRGPFWSFLAAGILMACVGSYLSEEYSGLSRAGVLFGHTCKNAGALLMLYGFYAFFRPSKSSSK